jgi:hypothetical protein
VATRAPPLDAGSPIDPSKHLAEHRDRARRLSEEERGDTSNDVAPMFLGSGRAAGRMPARSSPNRQGTKRTVTPFVPENPNTAPASTANAWNDSVNPPSPGGMVVASVTKPLPQPLPPRGSVMTGRMGRT